MIEEANNSTNSQTSAATTGPVVRELKKLTQILTPLLSNDSEVSVNNLDEIKLHLRKELSLAAQKIIDGLSSLESGNIEQAQDTKDLKDTIKDLNKLLKAKKFNPTIKVAAPIVPTIKVPGIRIPTIRVPEPKVTVNPPPISVNVDLDELLDALKPLSYLSNKASKPITVRTSDGKKFIKEIKSSSERVVRAITSGGGGITQDEFKNTQRKYDDPLSRYKIAQVDDDSSPNYYGYINLNSGWYILKETVVSGDTTYRYSSGVGNFPSNWSGRTLLTYDYLYNVVL